MKELVERETEKSEVWPNGRADDAENTETGSSARAVPPHSLTPTPEQAQTLWASVLIEELIRQGVGLFILAPGSRSTPLVLAVAENPKARHLIHFDERGGAFVALGFARATGRPAVWITTSGTAVANGLPAVIEADSDGIPLIMVTADRPPELRETGANQTIRQPGIFEPYVRWQFDLPVPDPAIHPAFVLTTAGQAVHRSLSPAGPVHLNCMFREPFSSEGKGLDAAAFSDLDDWLSSGCPYTRYPPSLPSVSESEIEALATRLEDIEQGLVVLGKSDAPPVPAAAARLAAALGWPLLADVASGGRLGEASAIPYDLLLGSMRFCDANRAQAVVHLGGRIISKRFQRYIEQTRPANYIVVRPDAIRSDPGHLVTDRVQSDVTLFCEILAREFVPSSGPSMWMQAWTRASTAAEDAVEKTLSRADLCEPAVARSISMATPEDHGIVLGSSMPIRDMDAFAVGNGARLRVAANRGASGIDGTVATAAGFARGLDRPTTLLIGDLALLHDLNSLALLRDGPSITVVVINNDGGGIFSFLPIARQEPVFEPFFGTPHGLAFEKAAAMFGLGYAQPKTLAEFEAACAEATSRDGASIIEVCTDRKTNVALHQEILDAVVRAVEEAIE